MESTKSGYVARLPFWVLAGALLGVAMGLFLGDEAAVFKPIGTTYTKLLEIVVLPYIICSLLHGLGRLSPDTALRLFRSSWSIYLLVWGATFAVIFVLSLGIPPVPPPSFIDATADREGLGLLDALVPANPFFDLASNQIPAIVIFSAIFGIAIQRTTNKRGMLQILELVRSASVTIWQWIVRLAPFGVFALFADTAGTAEPQELADLSLYLMTVIAGTFIIAFWVLPSLMAALCPSTTREILRDLQSALVIAVVTSLSVAALPFVQQATERLAARLNIVDDNRGEIISTTLAISYPLGQLGNYFIWLFILFAAFYFRVPIDADEQVLLPFIALLSGIGSPSSSIGSVEFLSKQLGFPEQTTSLYVGLMAITRYGQVVASVMGFAFISFLVTLNYYGHLKLRIPRLAISLTVSIALLLATVVTGRIMQYEFVHRNLPYFGFTLAPDITEGVSVVIEDTEPSAAESKPSRPAKSGNIGSLLDTIQITGEIRVGYNPNMIPFSYKNSDGELVGYDIAFAYQLARDLDVRLRLLPFSWDRLNDDLKDRRFDLVASGVYVTDERLQQFEFSEPYHHSPIALIVRSDDADRFRSRMQIEGENDLTIAVFNDPFMKHLAQRTFPTADIVTLPDYQTLPDHAEIHAAFWTLEQAKSWAAARQNFTAIMPEDLSGHLMMAYIMPEGEHQFRQFVNYWLRLQRLNGFHERMVQTWLHGKPETERQPRWSIMRNVLGWKNEE